MLAADVVAIVMVPAAPSLAALVHAVKAASALTQDSGTARIEMTLKATVTGIAFNSTVTETTEGITDFRRGLADLVTAKGPAAGLEIRLAGGMAYEKLPALLQAARHSPTPWVSSPAPAGAGGSGAPGTSPTGSPGATISQMENMPLSAITVVVGTSSMTGTTNITTDFYDFGVPVDVQPPPPDQVTPASSLGLPAALG